MTPAGAPPDSSPTFTEPRCPPFSSGPLEVPHELGDLPLPPPASRLCQCPSSVSRPVTIPDTL